MALIRNLIEVIKERHDLQVKPHSTKMMAGDRGQDSVRCDSKSRMILMMSMTKELHMLEWQVGRCRPLNLWLEMCEAGSVILCHDRWSKHSRLFSSLVL